MYDNTLIVFTADNGGPVYEPGSANNHPLKGRFFGASDAALGPGTCSCCRIGSDTLPPVSVEASMLLPNVKHVPNFCDADRDAEAAGPQVENTAIGRVPCAPMPSSRVASCRRIAEGRNSVASCPSLTGAVVGRRAGRCRESVGRPRAVYQALLLPGTGANPRLTYLAEDSHTGIYRHTSELKKQVLTMGPPSFFRELPLAPAHNQRPRYL